MNVVVARSWLLEAWSIRVVVCVGWVGADKDKLRVIFSEVMG